MTLQTFASRLTHLRQMEGVRRSAAVRKLGPPKVQATPQRDGFPPPSDERELYADGDRTRYRVRRGLNWIDLPVVSIQHR